MKYKFNQLVKLQSGQKVRLDYKDLKRIEDTIEWIEDQGYDDDDLNAVEVDISAGTGYGCFIWICASDEVVHD